MFIHAVIMQWLSCVFLRRLTAKPSTFFHTHNYRHKQICLIKQFPCFKLFVQNAGCMSLSGTIAKPKALHWNRRQTVALRFCSMFTTTIISSFFNRPVMTSLKARGGPMGAFPACTDLLCCSKAPASLNKADRKDINSLSITWPVVTCPNTVWLRQSISLPSVIAFSQPLYLTRHLRPVTAVSASQCKVCEALTSEDALHCEQAPKNNNSSTVAYIHVDQTPADQVLIYS